MSSRNGFRLILMVVAAAATVAALMVVLDRRRTAAATVEDIEAQLAALDPVTRAAVVARLGKDAVDTVRDR